MVFENLQVFQGTAAFGRYQHRPSSAAFLDPSSPSCLASIAGFLAHPSLRESYEHLADIVRQEGLRFREKEP